ncbi:MAG: hypothetical protein HRU09_08865 [Oligoflexales bacterium]|nr:hypothetical protein [Oligoflexales bacterium]
MDEKEYTADKTEREFLHDLSNPLAIAYGNLKIISAKIEADRSAMDMDAVLTKVNKALKAFEKANALLDKRRNHIKNNAA